MVGNRYSRILLGTLILFLLYLTSLYSYLLFHSLVELFSIVVASGIFIIAWNSRFFMKNNYLLFLGIAYLFIAGVDLIHTLSYSGMGVFKEYGPNLPTQLWIGARYMESLSLLIAPVFFYRSLDHRAVLGAYAVVFALLMGSIFYWGIFPTSYVEGEGLTPFKKGSEGTIANSSDLRISPG